MNDVILSELRVGEPTRCGAMAVYPLFAERTLFPEHPLDYQLSDEAQEAGTCAVRELSEPKVGELLVENSDDRPVLFLEGEIVQGGKQDRVVRSSTLVPGATRVAMQVYCIEHGRWDGSAACLKTRSHSPPSLRHLLKGGSPSTRLSPWSNNQLAVWRFISAKHEATGVRSPKGNISDTLQSRPEVVKSLRNDFRYPDGACGIAVSMSGKTVGIDLFDRPETLRKVWDRLVVLGLTLDALDMRSGDASDPDLSVRLYKVRNVRWKQVESVGLGDTFTARDGDGSLATALVVDGTPIHLSVSMSPSA